MELDYTLDELSKMIDHSLLHPTMTDEELIKGAALAVDYNCASVCIKPYFVKIISQLLDGTVIKTGTGIGFPHGNSSTAVKVVEAKQQAGMEHAEFTDQQVRAVTVWKLEADYLTAKVLEKPQPQTH